VHECTAERVLELLLTPQLCGRRRTLAEGFAERARDPRRIDESAVDIQRNYPMARGSP
jgi:hypothetical protein